MYDLVIIGAGPAGFSASIYASCFKLSHLLIGKILGGQMVLSPDIVNYPGFVETSGTALTNTMVEQVKKRGAEIVNENVTVIKKQDDYFVITSETQKTFETKTIILATGVERRKLNVPGETEYTGKGVQYCTTCEKFEYEGRTVAVVGGANAACQGAVQLSHAAKKVSIIYRGSQLRCDAVWLEEITKNPNIEVLANTKVAQITGDGQKITGVTLSSTTDVSTPTTQLAIERLFIEIGGVPGTALLIPLGLNMDPGGFLSVNGTLATNIPGIFAAGDVVSHKYSIEQISSAVGLGARAAVSAFSYLKGQKAPSLWGSSQINRV